MRSHGATSIMEKSGSAAACRSISSASAIREFGTLKFSPQELAIVCELLLRGAQTAGELRTRAAAWRRFADTARKRRTL